MRIHSWACLVASRLMSCCSFCFCLILIRTKWLELPGWGDVWAWQTSGWKLRLPMSSLVLVKCSPASTPGAVTTIWWQKLICQQTLLWGFTIGLERQTSTEDLVLQFLQLDSSQCQNHLFWYWPCHDDETWWDMTLALSWAQAGQVINCSPEMAS